MTGFGSRVYEVLSADIMAEFFAEFCMEKKSAGEHSGNYHRFQVSMKV